MRSAELRKLTRSLAGRQAGEARSSMEFSDLLDAVAPQPMTASPLPDSTIAELVMFRVTPQTGDELAPPLEPSVEPVLDAVVEPPAEITAVSRFPDIGIDDDLLPVRAPSRRRFRR